MIDQLKPLIGKLCSFSQKRLGFANPPKLFLRNDPTNSQDTLGKTAFYDPNEKSVTLFIHNRHPKDILRSFAHELVHHAQNLRGDLAPEKITSSGPGYAQECPHMRKMEKEAYLKGNMCFRDWEDKYKLTLQESIFLKENKKVNLNNLKDIIKNVIQEKVISEENQAEYMLKKYSYSKGGANMGEKLALDDPTMDRYDAAGNPMEDDAKQNYYLKKKIQKFQHDIRSRRFDMQSDFKKQNFEKMVAASSAELKRLGAQQQRLLKRIGFRDMKQLQKMVGAPVTGVYDVDTNSKIKRFQKSLGFSEKLQDGVFGPGTMRKLKASKKSPKQQADDIVKVVGNQVNKMMDKPDEMGAKIASKVASGTPAERPTIDTLSMGRDPVTVRDLSKGQKLDQIEDEEERRRQAQSGPKQESVAKITNEVLKEMIEAQLKKLLESEFIPEENEIEEGDCKISAGVRDEDEYMTEETEDIDEGKAHGKCKNGCQCEPIQENEEPEEKKKKGKYDDGDDKDEKCDYIPCDESVIKTPEQENALYEQRFTPKNNRLFEKLLKEWTK